MEQPAGSFPSDRRLIGRIIIAVILGESVWVLIVSVMNNLVVPWLGDVMGQSSGLPTSFVQRPYNYPELFVSVLEVCIAGLVAAILNYFVGRPQVHSIQRVKSVKSSVPAGPVRMFPEAVKTTAAEVPVAQTPTPQAAQIQSVQYEPTQNQVGPGQSAPPVALPSAIKAEPVVASAPVTSVPARSEPPATEVKLADIIIPSAPVPVASEPPKPASPSPKAVSAKPKKNKEVYYNIVGEPMPSDDE